jgi:hypothetical protein
MKPNKTNHLLIKSLVLIVMICTLLNACANKGTAGSQSKITVSNTGNYPMQPVKLCYYQTDDYPSCSPLEELSELSKGSSHNFLVRTNQKTRLVFPFDNTVSFAGVMYRPNCHILLDFNASEEKRYYVEAQLLSLSANPSDGFNCKVKLFEQNLGAANKEEITSKVSKTIRYQVPMKGKEPANYISDYDFKY